MYFELTMYAFSADFDAPLTQQPVTHNVRDLTPKELPSAPKKTKRKKKSSSTSSPKPSSRSRASKLKSSLHGKEAGAVQV